MISRYPFWTYRIRRDGVQDRHAIMGGGADAPTDGRSPGSGGGAGACGTLEQQAQGVRDGEGAKMLIRLLYPNHTTDRQYMTCGSYRVFKSIMGLRRLTSREGVLALLMPPPAWRPAPLSGGFPPSLVKRGRQR